LSEKNADVKYICANSERENLFLMAAKPSSIVRQKKKYTRQEIFVQTAKQELEFISCGSRD
jgi:hypothetical protein